MIAIIPARGGSKGIQNKNLQLIGGKTLLQKSIEICLSSKNISSIYVTSDSDDILNESKKHKVNLIKRPKHLSKDTSSSESALIHTLENLNKDDKNEKNILFVQVTSPFTTSYDIDEMYQIFLNKKYDSMFSSKIFHGFIWKEENDIMNSIAHDQKNRLRRQDLDPIYKENGALYLFKKSKFLKNKSRFFGKIGTYIMPSSRSLEIDDHFDLFLARTILKFNEKK